MMLGLSIRSLLIGSFGLMCLIIAGQGVMAVGKIAAVNESVVDIATKRLPSIDVIRHITTIASRMRLQEARHVFASGDNEMARSEKRFGDQGSRRTRHGQELPDSLRSS